MSEHVRYNKEKSSNILTISHVQTATVNFVLSNGRVTTVGTVEGASVLL
jgi:hypothetical protein